MRERDTESDRERERMGERARARALERRRKGHILVNQIYRRTERVRD